MKDQKPSARGEYEITYINDKYLKEKKLNAVTLKKKWLDVGTIDSLHEATAYLKRKAQKSKKRA